MTLSIKNATKQFGDFTAVDDISLDVAEGQMHGFLGANGAGKTTTFRMALGLLTPTQGEVLWQGRRISYADSPDIGYLPEERGLYPKMKVQDQLVYLAQLRRMGKKQAEQGATEWLERFEVPHYANKKVEELSKGNQQKIQLIASLLHNPKLLILDEPFSGLDPVNVEMLKKAILDFQKQGATIVFSSHRMDHVEELCDDMSILDKGKLIVHGSIREVKRTFGKQNVRIHSDFDITALSAVPGVEKFTAQRGGGVFRVTDEAVGQTLLARALEIGPVRQFALEEPSLEEIFIEKVGRAHV
ncbi:ABC transporter ATP-binding protein [Planococcus maritimus]|uniref:ABC transporter ATP-binding protein n=1 Tax=Planococcus maritimus TaxID=192421 RepID=UPI00079B217A|nr:ABC transporter ATP-binding protein [Planococcus maritimus]KYG57507.1 sodium ABC transporter ATP-binding protein [Planococcus maritimus]OED31360.1 sodium ABC transporter ATP-binding protein [Planococcus maritimus]